MVRWMMLCRPVFALLLALPAVLPAQVMQTHRLDVALQRARTLRAGASATDIAHHIHYDLTYLDRLGHSQSATYDIYRDPIRYTRVDIVAGDYHDIEITDWQTHQVVASFNGDMPLKIYDFVKTFEEPQSVIYGLEHNQHGIPQVRQEMVNNAPYFCSDDGIAIRLCFDPFIHSFAFAQVYNQTFTYEDWRSIGTHAFPAKVQIFDNKKVIVTATGKTEPVKQFPKLFFQLDAAHPPKQEDHHQVMHMATQKTDPAPLFGYVQIQLNVDADGKVTKATALDFDDKQIVKPSLRIAKGLEFAPDNENGAPAPFSTLVYLQYFPRD
jgi:hypothetical protein